MSIRPNNLSNNTYPGRDKDKSKPRGIPFNPRQFPPPSQVPIVLFLIKSKSHSHIRNTKMLIHVHITNITHPFKNTRELTLNYPTLKNPIAFSKNPHLYMRGGIIYSIDPDMLRVVGYPRYSRYTENPIYTIYYVNRKTKSNG